MLKSGWVAAAASLLAYTVITCAIGRDVLAQLGSTIANDSGDPLLTAAILKWSATHVPLTEAWYQFPIFHPTRDALTFSEHLLGLSVIASPIYWVTRDLVVTYNLVLLLTFPLCAMAMFGLVYRMTGSVAAAFVAGLAFGFAPYRVSHLGHIQILAAFWAPLALLGLHAYLETSRRRWLVLYGAAWVLQGAASGYMLVMFSMLVGLWTLWFVARRRRWRALVMIGVATVVAVLPLAPVLFRYLTVHAQFGFVRDYWENRVYSADIAGLLCAPQPLTLWGWVRVHCGPEGELFPGVAMSALTLAGLVGVAVRSWRAEAIQGGPFVTLVRRVLLFVAAFYAIVILVLLAWGPFAFELGPVSVQASRFLKPVQVVTLAVALALALSPRVRAMARESGAIGFYILAAMATWALALGPTTKFMGALGVEGPYRLLLSLPGFDSLRVPARFWLMTTICLSVVAGLVVAEFVRRRSRGASAIAATLVGLAVLGDGWVDRIHAAALPAPVPGADRLAGATVLEAPPDLLPHGPRAVFRAVAGGWRTINGYSGWWPGYYAALVAAGRIESDGMVTPFQRFGELHVLVSQDAPRLRALIERQPGATRVASDDALVLYRLPARPVTALSRPAGQRLRPSALRSECASELVSRAGDDDETSLWQCSVRDEHQTLIVDLGAVSMVGSIVHSLGPYSSLFPSLLVVETSQDGSSWTEAWVGPMFEQAILAAMAEPKRLGIVAAFPPRPARFIRLRAATLDSDVPWSIAEIEVWSSSAESR